jgi:hypothetical protein
MPKPTETESSNTFRDEKGRFLTDNGGGPGRPKSSRNRLANGFLDELNRQFQEHGAEAIAKVRQRSPEVFCKLIANLLPRELLVAALNVNATISPQEIESAQGWLAAYRFARDRIGAPLIEAELDHVEEGAIVTDDHDD